MYNPRVRVRLDSVGCRLNIGEMEALARQLTAAGHLLVGPGERADLCVFNSCTVTGEAARKSRHAVRRLKRSNPGAVVVATGCYAELSPEQTRGLGVDLLVGNSDKDRLAEILADAGLLPGPQAIHGSEVASRPVSGSRGLTRAFLKVQDGCDNRCTFCIVTVARGRGRSMAASRVVEAVRSLLAAGYREVVLSGVHLGSWGHDLEPRLQLTDLVRQVLDETDLRRLRLSSLEPWDLDGRFVELLRDPRVLPHLHLPLQSGCEATLRRMGRRTTPDDFRRLVEAARQAAPDVAISTDVMVGFPGETEREFRESLRFVAEMGFSRLHVFRYSSRPGTAAARMQDQVPAPLRQQRSGEMHTLGAELERSFCHRFVGRTLPALWERCDETNGVLSWSGLTDNYIRVISETSERLGPDLRNRVTAVRLERLLTGGTVSGHVLA